MVALLASLQTKLTLRGFRGNTAKIVGLVILTLYTGGIVLGLLTGSFFLRTEPASLIGPVTTLAFGFITLMWPILMVLFGSNDALAPSRFALLPVRASDLQPGLLVAALLTMGGIVSALLTLGYLTAWSARLEAFLVALVAGVFGLAFAVLITRTLTAAISATLASRKFRDWIALIVGLVAMLAAFSGQLMSWLLRGRGEVTGAQLDLAAEVVGWTPFGWVWSLPWDVARGAWLAAAAKAVLTVVSSGLLWVAWGRFLDRALTSPLEAGGGAKKIKGHGRIEKLMPGGPVGAIGGRTLRYWARDPRRKVQAISVLILPVVLTFAMMNSSSPPPPEALLIIPVATFALVGLTLGASEICYDGSALWEQVAGGTRGQDDRLGRIIGLGWIFGPFSIVLCVGYLAWSGAWQFAGVALGAMVGVLLIAAGVGSWTGAIWNYPMPPPGAGMNSRGNLGAIGGMLLGMLVEGALLLPVGGLAIASAWVPVLLWISPLVSVAVGALALWAGVKLGGAYLDAHWPEVLKRITWDKP